MSRNAKTTEYTIYKITLVFAPSRLIDLTTRHRAETEMETDRLRQAQIQAERLLESRERANRQKVKGLEETVSLSELLTDEIKISAILY